MLQTIFLFAGLPCATWLLSCRDEHRTAALTVMALWFALLAFAHPLYALFTTGEYRTWGSEILFRMALIGIAVSLAVDLVKHVDQHQERH